MRLCVPWLCVARTTWSDFFPRLTLSLVCVLVQMDKNIFTMDVQYPLSMVQAFEISLAGVDTKIICD